MIVINEGQADQKTTVQSVGTRIAKFAERLHEDSGAWESVPVSLRTGFVARTQNTVDRFSEKYSTDWTGMYAELVQTIAEFLLLFGDDDVTRAWLVSMMTVLTIGE